MIHVIPGMGADHQMFSASAWRALPSAQFHDWPCYRGEKTISAIAERVISEAQIGDGDTVIGTSLGGIVGCEIANRRQLHLLVLIGSAQSSKEISALLTLLHPLATLAPLDFIRTAAGKLPGELCEMFSNSDADFIRAMCCAIFTWPGLEASRMRPLRIHGRHDHVIPPPASADLLLDGGHLIAMTHATECVAYLQSAQPWNL